MASMPCSRATSSTGCAPEASARSATRTTIGLPPMSASGLLGRRVEASRAGTTAMKGGAAGAVAWVIGRAVVRPEQGVKYDVKHDVKHDAKHDVKLNAKEGARERGAPTKTIGA